MRNLKRALSLVLATVMVIGMMVVGASAASYKDDASIDYKEAVDVMSAVGMIEGWDGSFGPDLTIDRAGAAKLIAYLKLGKATADSIKPSEDPFTDVSKDAWYAGYMAYCKSEGLMEGYAGYGDPNGTMTAYGFGTMLLAALGYDRKIEGLTGSTWEVNTAKLAIKNGLFAGNDGAMGNVAMTRQEAALYAFNALKATTVDYANRGTEITLSDGATIIMGASPAEPVVAAQTSGTDDVRYDLTNDHKVQLCESLYPTLKLYASENDAFGRPAHEWKLGKPVKSVGKYADVAELVYEGEVKGGTIYADLGKPTVTDATIYTDSAAGSATVAIANNNKTSISGPGAVVEIFTTVSDAGTAVDVVITNTYFGKVASVTAAKGDAKAYVTVGGMRFETEAFAKDDAVIYTKADGKIQTMALAETFTGKVTKITNDGVYTIDGAEYELSAKQSLSLAVNHSYDFYMDAQGYIIGATEVEGAAAQYGVLLALNNAGWTGASTKEVKLLLADGTVATVDAKGTVNNDELVDANIGKIFSYTVKDDVYTVSETTDANGTAGTIKAGNATVSYTEGGAQTMTVNNKTVFVVDNGDDTYAVYTGMAKVPSMTGVTFKAAKDDNGVAVLVYVTAGTKTGDEAADLLYIAKASHKSYTTVDGTFHTYNVVKDGATTTVTMNAAAYGTLTASDLYKNVYYDEDGIITALTPAVDADYTAATGTGADNAGIIALGGTAYGYASDVVVFSVDGDGVISTLAIADIADDDNDSVLFTTNKAGIVTAIYLAPVAGAPVAVDNVADGKVLPGAVATGSGTDVVTTYGLPASWVFPEDNHLVLGFNKADTDEVVDLTIKALDGTVVYHESKVNSTVAPDFYFINVSRQINNADGDTGEWCHKWETYPVAGTFYYVITVGGVKDVEGTFTI